MAKGDTTIGTNTTFTFAGVTANITRIGWDGVECGTVNASHMKTSDWHAFLACDLTDPGEVTIDAQLKANETLVVGDTDALTILLPDTTTWSATAICTGFSFEDPMEELIICTMTFKVTGAIGQA